MEGGLTATDTFGNTGSGELYSLGGKIFLVSKNSGIIELENDTNTPKLVSNTTVRKLFVTEKYMFIQNQDDELLRFSEDTSLEPVAGQDKYRNLSFFQDATGEVLVKGVDISTSSDIVGRIRPEQNDIELIESLPFDAEVTELIKLN